MAPTTSVDALASALVARFLRTNNYSDTLQAFIREAGLPSDVGQSSGDDTNHWSIQSLLEEKKTFDHSANFERYGEESEENDQWRVPGELSVVPGQLSSLEEINLAYLVLCELTNAQHHQNLLSSRLQHQPTC